MRAVAHRTTDPQPAARQRPARVLPCTASAGTQVAPMAKYEPLRRYLARQKAVRVEMTFSEIERMIGSFLPKRAQSTAWWERRRACVGPGQGLAHGRLRRPARKRRTGSLRSSVSLKARPPGVSAAASVVRRELVIHSRRLLRTEPPTWPTPSTPFNAFSPDHLVKRRRRLLVRARHLRPVPFFRSSTATSPGSWSAWLPTSHGHVSKTPQQPIEGQGERLRATNVAVSRGTRRTLDALP